MPRSEDISPSEPEMMDVELFVDQVLEIVRQVHEQPALRIRVVGTIAGGQPIEAVEEPHDDAAVPGPDAGVQKHPAFHVLRRSLCPSLLSVSGDAFELARIITPLLAGLKLSGKVDIALDPWLFAGMALVIERMGVAAFCAGYEKDEDRAADHEAAPPEAQAPEPKCERH